MDGFSDVKKAIPGSLSPGTSYLIYLHFSSCAGATCVCHFSGLPHWADAILGEAIVPIYHPKGIRWVVEESMLRPGQCSPPASPMLPFLDCSWALLGVSVFPFHLNRHQLTEIWIQIGYWSWSSKWPQSSSLGRYSVMQCQKHCCLAQCFLLLVYAL